MNDVFDADPAGVLDKTRPYVVCQAAVGRGEDGLVMAFALVAFTLVMGLADGVGAQRGEGGQEHGALETLVNSVGDVLTADR